MALPRPALNLPRMKRGHTLIELLTVLTLLAILLAIATPRVSAWRDAAAARAARDELAARLAWTRIAAASHGGAALILDLPGARYRVELGDGVTARAGDLRGVYGVAIESGTARDSLVLRYDALGIGRTTGGTLHVRRGDAVAGLTVTPYGRYRRW
jgi:prepilin-type N-terminal cleavage/methylation domain-containing protein